MRVMMLQRQHQVLLRLSQSQRLLNLLKLQLQLPNSPLHHLHLLVPQAEVEFLLALLLRIKLTRGESTLLT